MLPRDQGPRCGQGWHVCPVVWPQDGSGKRYRWASGTLLSRLNLASVAATLRAKPKNPKPGLCMDPSSKSKTRSNYNALGSSSSLLGLGVRSPGWLGLCGSTVGASLSCRQLHKPPCCPTPSPSSGDADSPWRTGGDKSFPWLA